MSDPETTIKFRVKTLLNEEVSVRIETINRQHVLFSLAVSRQPTVFEPPKGVAVAISRTAATALYNALGDVLGRGPVFEGVGG